MVKGLRFTGLHAFLAMMIAFVGFAGMANMTSAQATYTVSGQVVDQDDEPLAGAEVCAGAEPTRICETSDGNGMVSYDAVPNGTHTATATFDGYTSDSKTFTVNGADVTGLAFKLTKQAPATHTVSGQVVDQDGDGLPGAEITGGVTNVFRTTSDANGNFSRDDIPNGTHTATATLEGYTPDSVTFTVRDADVTGLVPELEKEAPDDSIDALIEELVALLIEILEDILASGK